MSEVFRAEQAVPVIPPRFNDFPYCNPGSFAGSALDVLEAYDPVEVAGHPDFLDTLAVAYDNDKAGNDGAQSPKTDGYQPPTFNLLDPAHLEGMTSHLLAHSITGLIDGGVSNTDCIPYWDREAMIVGTQRQDPVKAPEKIELIDALSMNVLRSYCHFLGGSAVRHKNNVVRIESALQKGRRSMLDMRLQQEERIQINRQEAELYTGLYIAKLKHLAWLVDQQPDPSIRQHMRREVGDYVGVATTVLDVPAKDLTIDMGGDTGISKKSGRPLYDISMFVQLQHIHNPSVRVQTYSLPQRRCDRLAMVDVLTSIDREGADLPFYEQDGRYRLPWKFVD